jgi:hypothetical protein
MMKPVLSWPLAALLLVLVAGLAFICGNRYAFKSGHRQGVKMQQLFAQSRAAMDPVLQQIHAKQAELDAQLDAPAPDTAAIETLASELGALRGKIYAEQAELRARLAKAGLPAHPVSPHVSPHVSSGMPGYGPAYAPAAGSLPDCCQ